MVRREGTRVHRVWHDESVRAVAALLLVLSGALDGCGEGTPHVDVALTPVLDDAPRATSSAGRPVARTVAHADASDIDTHVPAGACGPPDAPLVRDTGMLTELEALPILLRRVLRDDVARCARAAHERDASMQGLLVLSFELTAPGDIERTRVAQGAGDAALHRCIEDAFDAASTPTIIVGGITHFPLVLCEDGRVQWRERDTYR